MFTLNCQQTQNIIGKCSPDDSVILREELESVSDMLDTIGDNALGWVEHVEVVLSLHIKNIEHIKHVKVVLS